MKLCFPQGIRCIWARSAGAAIGILRRDKVDGILLEFDLYQSPHGDHNSQGKRSRFASAKPRGDPSQDR